MNDYNWQILLLLFFIPFILIALFNLKVLILQLLKKGNHSYVPLFGIWMFFIGTLGLENGYNKWIWLFVLLDVGTILILLWLPLLIKELFLTSRFCRYRVYQNDTQRLTLYKFKHYQSFNWQYTADTTQKHTPFLAGFGGDWLIENEYLYLNSGNDNIAIAKINHQEIVFIKTKEYYEFLQHQSLKIDL